MITNLPKQNDENLLTEFEFESIAGNKRMFYHVRLRNEIIRRMACHTIVKPQKKKNTQTK